MTLRVALWSRVNLALLSEVHWTGGTMLLRVNEMARGIEEKAGVINCPVTPVDAATATQCRRHRTRDRHEKQHSNLTPRKKEA